MWMNAIAIGVVAGFIVTPVLAQTAIQQEQADIIANVVQIADEIELGEFATSGNVAIVSQTTATPLQGSNALEINQFNSGNRVFVMQQSIYPDLFSEQSDNVLNVSQDGFGNRVYGTQSGTANEGDIFQQGNENSASLAQVGGLHRSTIRQHGNGLVAESVQIGVGSQPIDIHQMGTGAPTVSVTRTAP